MNKDLLSFLQVSQDKRSTSRKLAKEILLFANGNCQIESLELASQDSSHLYGLLASSTGGSVIAYFKPLQSATSIGNGILGDIDSVKFSEREALQMLSGFVTTQFRDSTAELLHDFRARYWYLSSAKTMHPVVFKNLLPAGFVARDNCIPKTRSPKWPTLPFSDSEASLFSVNPQTESTSVCSLDRAVRVVLSGNRQRWRAEFPVAVFNPDEGELSPTEFATVEQEGSVAYVPELWRYPIYLICHFLDLCEAQYPQCVSAAPSNENLFAPNPQLLDASHELNSSKFKLNALRRDRWPVAALSHSYVTEVPQYVKPAYSTGSGSTYLKENITCILLADGADIDVDVIYSIQKNDETHTIECRSEQSGQFLHIWNSLNEPESKVPCTVMSMEHMPRFYYKSALAEDFKFDLLLVKALVLHMIFTWTKNDAGRLQPSKKVMDTDGVETVEIPEKGRFVAFGNGLVSINFADRVMLNWHLDLSKTSDKDEFCPVGEVQIIETSGEQHEFTWSPTAFRNCKPSLKLYLKDAIDFAQWAYASDANQRLQQQLNLKYKVKGVEQCMKRNQEILRIL